MENKSFNSQRQDYTNKENINIDNFANSSISKDSQGGHKPRYSAILQMSNKSNSPTIETPFNDSISQKKMNTDSIYTEESSFYSINSKMIKNKGTSIHYTPNRTMPILKMELEITDFYSDVLRELESLRFSKSISISNNGNGKPVYEIDCDKFFTNEEARAFDYISAKLGEASYELLRRLFHTYSSDKKSVKLHSAKDFNNFCKEFKLSDLIPQAELHLLFIKQVPKKFGEFKDFVDLLFRIARKLSSKSIFSNNMKLNSRRSANKEEDNNSIFNWFLDEFIVPHYLHISYKNSDYALENIVAFRLGTNESPLLEFIVRNDDFFKKLFLLYSQLDLKLSSNPCITLKSFLKFAQEYEIVPFIVTLKQISILFKYFQIESKEIIEFSEFLLVIACCAHIGFIAENRNMENTFSKKFEKMLEFLRKVDSRISEKLILQNVMTSKV